MTIFDLITSKDVKDFWVEAGSNREAYLGAAFFPTKKQLGMELSYLKGNKGLPVSLKGSAFDTDVPLRDRQGLTEMKSDMPFFREGMSIDEKQRQQLLQVMQTGNQTLIDAILDNIFDDRANLLESAFVSKERMIMQLLAYGTITMNFQGSPVSYDYQFDTDHKLTLTSTDMWSDHANSDPIGDIETMQNQVRQDTGVTPTRAICNTKTLNDIIANEKIQATLKIKNLYPNKKNTLAYILEETGVDIAVYDKMYDGGKYYPDNNFTLIPEGNLGNFYYGTTPEEADLMGKAGADVELVDQGVAVSTQMKKDSPINVKTVVSMLGLPSAETMDRWAIISY